MSSYTANNKILVLARYNAPNSDIQLLRYNSNGHLDNNFANGGILSIVDTAANSDSYSASPVGYAEMNNGKIMVLMSMITTTNGTSVIKHKLVRYESNGTIDQSFGTQGQIEFQLRDHVYGTQSFYKTEDENFIITGSVNTAEFKGSYAMKFDQNGNLDKSYGNNGFVNINLSLPNNFFEGAYKDRWDNLYFPIFSDYYPDNSETYIVKLKQDGQYDNSFGNNGIQNISNFEVSEPKLYISSNKSIYLTGYHYATNSNFTTLLVKLDSSGRPDSSFGTNGKADNPINDKSGLGHDIIELPTGQILLSGVNSLVNNHQPMIASYSSTGQVEESFNFDGYIDINFNGGATSNGNFIEYNPMNGNAIFIGSSSKNLALAAVKCANGASINEFENVGTIYPNPSAGIFTIESELEFNSYRVLNSFGQVLINGTGKSIDCSKLSNGTYTLVITTDYQIYYKKLLKTD